MEQEAYILIIGNESGAREEIKKNVSSISEVKSLIKTSPFEGSWDIVVENNPNILLIHINEKYEEYALFIKKVKEFYHGISIIVISDYKESDYILNLYKAGIFDFINYPLDKNELETSFKKLFKEQVVAGKNYSAAGKIIPVFSSKGGIGVTTVAVNLAVSFALKQKAKVLLCDFVFTRGDVSIFIETEKIYTINELIFNFNRIDSVFLENSLPKTSHGVYILNSPENPEESDYINSSNLSTLLEKLRLIFDYIIIDTAHDYSDNNIVIFDHADIILNLATLELPCTYSCGKSLEIFQKLRYEKDKVKLIINRTNAKNQLEAELVEEQLQYPIFFKLPNDYLNIVKAINNGKPVVDIIKNAPINIAINELSEKLITAMNKEFKPDKNGFFGKLFGKK